MTPSMEQGIEVIMLPEIITGLGNMFLALKNRSSHLCQKNIIHECS